MLDLSTTISTGEAVRRLHLKSATPLYRMIARGELRAFRIAPTGNYRFDPADIDRLLIELNGGVR